MDEERMIGQGGASARSQPPPAATAGAQAPPVAASSPPPPPGPEAAPPETPARSSGDHRGVALLLGTVAVIAALVAARASALSSDATDAWQSALRTEVKRSTAAIEDIRYLYQGELPPTMLILAGRVQVEELRAAAATSPAASALTMEAEIQAGVVAATEGAFELATDPAYALPDGGLDLGRRLADLRMETPDLVALDPGAIAAEGDRLGAKAGSMTFALLPLGVAALLGAAAQPFGRARRWLLGGGTAALALGAAIALAVEALA